jgi:S-adenosylmethionine decarboxylase
MTHGRHVKILGQAPPDRLRDPARIRDLLTNAIEKVGMRLLGEPHIYEVEEEVAKLGVEPFEDEGGVTGVAVLSTSHVAIHTWPLRSLFILDVFSCRDFDADVLQQVVRAHLEVERMKVTDLSESLVWDEKA